MRDRRRITFTAAELAAIQHGVALRIDVCLFEVGRARDRKSRNFWATECAHLIAAYRKTYAYPSGKSLVEQIANRFSERLGNSLLGWDERHEG